MDMGYRGNIFGEGKEYVRYRREKNIKDKEEKNKTKLVK